MFACRGHMEAGGSMQAAWSQSQGSSRLSGELQRVLEACRGPPWWGTGRPGALPGIEHCCAGTAPGSRGCRPPGGPPWARQAPQAPSEAYPPHSLPATGPPQRCLSSVGHERPAPATLWALQWKQALTVQSLQSSHQSRCGLWGSLHFKDVPLHDVPVFLRCQRCLLNAVECLPR